MSGIIYSTHTLHPAAEEMLRQAGRLVVASSLKDEVLTEEGRQADVIIVRAPLPPTAAAISFIDRINRSDLDGLGWLMTGDHTQPVFDGH